MDFFVGLDVSLASTAICGKVVKETKMETEPKALASFPRSLSGTVVVVGLESGPLSQWLYKPLTEASFEVVLMETRQVKGALQAMRRDAEGIARLLQMGWFCPVHCKSISAQEMRAILTARTAIQQSAIDLELSLRGALRNFGLKIGRVGKGFFEARIPELVEGNLMLEAADAPILRARLECVMNWQTGETVARSG